jgi:glycosyltransferase involved in cell wall biosynthesis
MSLFDFFIVKKGFKHVRKRNLIVCSPGRAVVIFCSFLGGKNILLDAGWPLSDSSNSRNRLKLLRNVKNYLIDYLSFALSSKIVFETDIQIKRCCRKFFISRSKCYRVYTGFNEFQVTRAVTNKHDDQSRRTIFFRGKMNEEAGQIQLENLSHRISKVARMVVYTDKLLTQNNFHIDTVIKLGHVPFADIESQYLMSDVVVSQLGGTKRLKWTIPHKIFEAAYFGKPIVAIRNPGLSELFTDDEIYFIESNSDNEIEKAIIDLLNQEELRTTMAIQIKAKYTEQVGQDILQNQFDLLIEKTFS